LNQINTRVTELLHNFEEKYHQDDVFKLIDEGDDVKFTTGFDRKSIIEESKGMISFVCLFACLLACLFVCLFVC
jgi:hypothetical protein